MKKIVAVSLCILVVACAAPINRKSASNHAQAAQNAVKNNDWDSARRHWAKAVTNGELGGEPEQKMAVFYYEYGRALGVTCFFDESETYLKKAYELDKKTNGPVYMSLTELGRLNLDQKKYDRALKYYDEVIPMLEKMGAETEAPMEFSFMLDDYADMLSNSGMEQKASEYKQRADEIRKNNPKRHSISERTMYGTQCTKK